MAIFNSYVCLPEGTKLELVGGLEYVLCFHNIWESSSQPLLTHIFQSYHQPANFIPTIHSLWIQTLSEKVLKPPNYSKLYPKHFLSEGTWIHRDYTLYIQMLSPMISSWPGIFECDGHEIYSDRCEKWGWKIIGTPWWSHSNKWGFLLPEMLANMEI